MSDSPDVRRRRVALVRQLAARIPHPVAVMELAAVIESIGINDAVASEDYGCSDVFELAERLFPLVVRSSEVNRSRAAVSSRTSVQSDDDRERFSWATASSRGLLALAPLAFLVATIEILSQAGWKTGSVLALSLGASTAVLVASGPIFAASRRTAIYLGFGYRAPARRFLSLMSLGTLGVCSVIAGAAFAAANLLGYFDDRQRLTFALSLMGFALLWLVVSSLTLTGSAVVAMAVLAVGLASGVAAGFVWGAVTGLGVGYGLSTAVLFLAWVAGDLRSVSWPLPLPAFGPLLVEAVPYAKFGFLFSFLLLEPHVMAWLGRTNGSRINALTTLELSLTLGLPPLLLVAGFHEHGMRSFWRSARQLEALSDRSGFRTALVDLFRRRLTRYGIALVTFSTLWAVGIEIAHQLGTFKPLSQVVFLSGIAGFCLVGLAQFNCLFLLGLARPAGALAATYSGIVALAVVGIPLAFVNFRLPIVGFAVGAAVFAAVGFGWCRKALGSADHLYATAF